MSVQTQQNIIAVVEEIRDMLLEKNKSYGDSALNPRRIFASSDAVEQIKVRIDDKLSRIENRGGIVEGAFNDNDLLDLIGYLVLLRVALKRAEEDSPSPAFLEDNAPFELSEKDKRHINDMFGYARGGKIDHDITVTFNEPMDRLYSQFTKRDRNVNRKIESS